MKEITIKAYEVTELSDKAKEKAYYKWLEHHEYFWSSENEASLRAFEDIFPIKISGWSYGGQGSYVSWDMHTDHDIDELSGQRLATYLWNNYRNVIFQRKYLKSFRKSNRIKHPMVVQKQEADKKTGEVYFWTTVYSNMKTDTYNCPLTGYIIDNSLLDPIWKFMEKPDNTTFYNLVDACLDSWLKDCNDDYEYCTSMEYFVEDMESNGIMFDESGRII